MTFLQRILTMKQRLTMPLLAVLLGLAGFLLRLLQNLTGFEADTGLPLSGNVPAVLLPVLLAAAAVLLFLTARALPKGPVGQPFSAVFRAEDPRVLTALVLGVFLMAASGVLEITNTFLESGSVEYLTADGLVLLNDRVGVISARAMGALSVAAAVSAFPAVMAVRRENVSPLPVLAAPICLLARLVFAYRVHSVDPVLADYYLELLSLILLILALYRLSGFAAGCGSPRFFGIYSGLTTVLALTLLADGIRPAALLTLGGAVMLTGFQVLLTAPTDPDADPAD